MMTSGSALRLVADIGGTNARFAISDAAGHLECIRKMRVADFSDLGTALEAYRSAEGLRAPFDDVVVAAAGPVESGAIAMTNCPWYIRAEDLADFTAPGGSVRLLNDLEAVGYALPHLSTDELEVLAAGGEAVFGTARLAVNIGTGFGAALAHPVDGAWHVSAAEAGHMAFAAREDAEWAIRKACVTVEDVLSGPGLARVFALLSGHAVSGPEAVFEALGSEPEAGRALTLFTRYLGRIAGDLVLAAGAGGGVYLCGGLAPQWRADADLGLFFEAFAAKGPMTARMSRVPVYRIVADDPALLGLTFWGRQPS